MTPTLYTDLPSYWGGLVSMSQAGVSHFYGFDGQQNARLLIDATGAVINISVYIAFCVEKGRD